MNGPRKACHITTRVREEIILRCIDGPGPYILTGISTWRGARTAGQILVAVCFDYDFAPGLLVQPRELSCQESTRPIGNSKPRTRRNEQFGAMHPKGFKAISLNSLNPIKFKPKPLTFCRVRSESSRGGGGDLVT